MAAHGYEWGEPGLRSFAETYGVLERVTTIEPADNEYLEDAALPANRAARPGAVALSVQRGSRQPVGLCLLQRIFRWNSRRVAEPVLGVPMKTAPPEEAFVGPRPERVRGWGS